MLINLIEWLQKLFGDIPGAGLFQYITFRAGLAVILSLIISMLFGGRIIRFLRQLQIGETVRDLGLDGQKQKEGTPTMGGLIIIMAILIPSLLVAKLDNVYIILMIISTIWMAVIGFVDDYIKVFLKNKEGLSGKFKILGQVGLGLIIGITMMMSDDVTVRMDTETAEHIGFSESQMVQGPFYIGEGNTVAEKADYKASLTNVPFLKGNRFDYAWVLPMEESKAERWVWLLVIPLVIFIVTAVSNAANLTDGIDGLATGVSGIIALTLGVFAYVSGNAIAANYLDILHLPGTGELVIFAACVVGACIGFLWYNAFPAQVFMGDTGSLTLGGIIAALAIVLRKELLIPLLCGIFVVENLSVMLQVAYFKYTKKKYGEGRRIFKMSPLHHHYQKLGMHESKIVTRFWIVGIMLAVITVITLKIR
ncbi:MAG: phospho-N-acetylmuramoyl-pentapeptide-transferase [Saprospiraceae bacterium]|jgi:phospho-N-acetylmuramoyl-pentapeptide-transferase|nr:phospho-N-acetylmuramoyl-pentapeptide-transferase [Saprospiraceae bacterium]HRD80433.1 phospho-N-acetylmuramoyl-pentapeptide-transferase [Saprospiraceae bacterium]HRK83029.1 phospho-N-acetylmuramoyl-pentapeptide-transferase [Saprospiraceae bacterium]